MNKARRTEINKIVEKLEELKADIEMLQEEEQECYDNMPEAFKYSEKGERAEEAIRAFDDTLDNLDDAIENLGIASE